MTFSSELHAFAVKVELRRKQVFLGCAQAVHQSVVEGSAVTGAPGQPVDTGALRASWQLRFEGDRAAQTSTPMDYAPAIEDGRGPHGPLVLRSQVGGFHSVKLTRAGWPRIVADTANKVVR